MITIFVIITFIMDMLSKIAVVKYINLGESIEIINKFLYLTNVRNTGAAWSLFDNSRYFVLFISAIIIGVLIGYIIKDKPQSKMEKTAYGFILGGAIGNFANRVLYGYVIDFIDIKIFNYDYPIFNLADTFIVIGVILFIIYTWRCNDGNKSRKKQS